MHCTNCGTQINGDSVFCPHCGAQQYAQPIAIPTPASNPPIENQSLPIEKLSVGAKIWCWLCLIANFALANLTLVSMIVAMDSFHGYTENIMALAIASTLLAYTVFSGYIVLLAGKKVGFYLICAAAAIALIVNVVTGSYLQAVFCLINPFITWLLIQKTWKYWPEIDAAKKMAKRQRIINVNGQPITNLQIGQAAQQDGKAAQQDQSVYQQRSGQNPVYWKRGRSMKIWAIVNACIFFITVVPFVSLYFAMKAQKALSEEQFAKYYRVSLILNIATYVLFIIFMRLTQG